MDTLKKALSTAERPGPGSWKPAMQGAFIISGSIGETPLKGILLNPTFDSLKRDLIERVYVPKGPPNPNSYMRR